jgi:diguanylate cyclase (GGDEF)-like protein
MLEHWTGLFPSSVFMPHGHCFLWLPDVLWLHVISDGTIALAYFSIPLVLIRFVRQRADLVFKPVFLMFGVFILACGLTHVMSIWTIWTPVYYTEGLIKAITAMASIGTAVALWPLLPKALALPSPSQLAQSNSRMQQEIASRQRIQDELQESLRVLDQSNAALEFHATHDAITGLANRDVLCRRITRATAQRRRKDALQAVVFVDLDHFKIINDGLGHNVGDQVLKVVASRISGCIREGDTLARLGSDEFALVLTHQPDLNVIVSLLQRILHTVRDDIHIGEHQISLTCSIGVSLFPQDGVDAETLLTQADVAMHRAKEHGRNNVQFFKREMNVRLEERLLFENRLRHAMERNEFSINYQPQVDARSGAIVGVEALLRWTHPELGAVPPAKFIPLAEEIGLIGEIGQWVLRTACRQNAEWQAAGLPAIPMAVNVSIRQFRSHEFLTLVDAALCETGLKPEFLDLELTESLLVEEPEWAAQVLADLRAIGISVSVDDFGTGYSSLSYLKRLPLNALKVDKSFIQDIRSIDDAVITRSIISLGHNLGLTVVAEGVETADQLQVVRELGCDRIQGYYFSKPLPSDQMTVYLERQQASRSAGVATIRAVGT